jgi:hypothetical protein
LSLRIALGVDQNQRQRPKTTSSHRAADKAENLAPLDARRWLPPALSRSASAPICTKAAAKSPGQS